jgi:uncharacterized protein
MKLNVLKTRTDPWYADGLSFTCTQCGNCCTGGPGYVWISREEIIRLAQFLKLSPEQVVERYCRKIDGRLSLNERRRGAGRFDCIFLEERAVERNGDERADGNGDGKIIQTRRVCTIYPVRPLQCRTWPFWPENLTSRRTWNQVAKRCPGMNTGGSYSVEQIHAVRDANEWPDRGPSSEKS